MASAEEERVTLGDGPFPAGTDHRANLRLVPRDHLLQAIRRARFDAAGVAQVRLSLPDELVEAERLPLLAPSRAGPSGRRGAFQLDKPKVARRLRPPCTRRRAAVHCLRTASGRLPSPRSEDVGDDARDVGATHGAGPALVRLQLPTLLALVVRIRLRPRVRLGLAVTAPIAPHCLLELARAVVAEGAARLLRALERHSVHLAQHELMHLPPFLHRAPPARPRRPARKLRERPRTPTKKRVSSLCGWCDGGKSYRK